MRPAFATETAVLANPAASPGDELAYALDVDGMRIVTGSPGEASSTGAAYVFDCTSQPCVVPVRVEPDGLAAGDRFGATVALSGDTLAVGAPGQQPGAVYVFVRSGSNWTQQARLLASGASASDGFGRLLALDGDHLVVAAASADNRTGAAYVFSRSGTAWTQQARLSAADAVAGDAFGRSVAVSGDTILVGAPLKAAAAGSFANGAAYAFVRNGTSWPQQAKLVASLSADGDSFGSSLAIEGERAIIGAPLAANHVGSAYVFDRAGSVWTQQAQLTRASGAPGDRFGWSVALSGNQVVVGAPYALDSCGASYTFANSGSLWSQTAGASIGTSTHGDLAGWAVAADLGRWVIAAPGNNGPLQHFGVAFWFDAVAAADIVFSDGFDAGGASACGENRWSGRSTR
ncbi:MAG: FG-GAP repeat protein [Dokdonella sp.]